MRDIKMCGEEVATCERVCAVIIGILCGIRWERTQGKKRRHHNSIRRKKRGDNTTRKEARTSVQQQHQQQQATGLETRRNTAKAKQKEGTHKANNR